CVFSRALRRTAKAVDRVPGGRIRPAEEYDGGSGPAGRRRRAPGGGTLAHDREDLVELLLAGRVIGPAPEVCDRSHPAVSGVGNLGPGGVFCMTGCLTGVPRQNYFKERA